MIKCTTDEDYEKFVFFFLHNRKIFPDTYSLVEAVGSIYTMMDETNILLFSHNQEDVIGAVSYSYGTRENNFKDNHIVFVDCALIKKEYQTSRFFIQAFQQMVKHIAIEHEYAKEMRFYAYRHHEYNCRLYTKFATAIEKRVDHFGVQDVFSVEFNYLSEWIFRRTRGTDTTIQKGDSVI